LFQIISLTIYSQQREKYNQADTTQGLPPNIKISETVTMIL
jgi:hypothetical protein